MYVCVCVFVRHTHSLAPGPHISSGISGPRLVSADNFIARRCSLGLIPHLLGLHQCDVITITRVLLRLFFFPSVLEDAGLVFVCAALVQILNITSQTHAHIYTRVDMTTNCTLLWLFSHKSVCLLSCDAFLCCDELGASE